MKKRKKQTELQQIERKFKRKTLSLIKEISTLSKEKSSLIERNNDLIKELHGMKNSAKEQERIIDMFKSCIDKSILEKVLRDDYICFLKAMYPALENSKDMFGSHAAEGNSYKYEVPK